MDPTKLPTDNLYKFVALTGVFLLGFSIWLTWTASARALDQRVVVESDADSAEMLAAAATDKLDATKHDLDSILKILDRLELTDGDETAKVRAFDFIRGERERILQRRTEAEQTQQRAREGMVKAKQSLHVLKRLSVDMEQIVPLSKNIASVGGMLAALGFVMWYFKLQRHLDAAVLRQALREPPKD